MTGGNMAFGTFAAIAILGAAVLVHELGHYAAARFLHIEMKELSLGFGKKLWQHFSLKTGIVYSIRLVPLGGYTEFLTDDDIVGKHAAPVALFDNQVIHKRIIIIAAGPLMNLLMALLLSLALTFCGNIAECVTAYADEISAIQASPPTEINTFCQSVSSYREALAHAFESPDRIVGFIGGTFTSIKIIAEHIAQSGAYGIIELLISSSVCIGLFNLLPIPGLDGGQIVMLLLEKVRGKKLTAQWQNMYDGLSLASIGLLLCIMGYNDIKALIPLIIGGI